MNDMLRLFCGGVILIGAIIVGREYSSYTARRIGQYQGFVALLSHIEGMISRFLTGGDELFRGFSNPFLEETGLLCRLREGKIPSDAFAQIEDKLLIGDGERESLTAFFKELGSGYRESEIERVSALKAELSAGYREEKAALEKSRSVVNTLLMGGAMGIFILLI
jgi:hypothetical protein